MFELKFLPGFLFFEVGRFRIRDSGFVRCCLACTVYVPVGNLSSAVLGCLSQEVGHELAFKISSGRIVLSVR